MSSKSSLEKFSSNEKYHLTPGDLGAIGFNGGKVSIVVELESPLLVGTSVAGGIGLLSRLPVDNVPDRKGEFYLRQF